MLVGGGIAARARSALSSSLLASDGFAIARAVQRSFHGSPSCRHGLYPFFNKHKKVTDPARQEPDHFEKEAERLPIDALYIDNLKKLWDEKIGSDRDLVFKAQDSLVATKDYGLPDLDKTQPKLDYQGIEALTNAPTSVKKIYSLAHGKRQDLQRAWRNEMLQKVHLNSKDEQSLMAKISWTSTYIRSWSMLYEEMMAKREKRKRLTKRPTWLYHRIYLMINYRRKLLRLLRESNEDEFQKVISELRIAYHVEKEPEHVKTRKAWSEAQIKRRIELEKEKKLSALHAKFMDGREENTAKIDAELEDLEQEEARILARLHQLDVIEGKTAANIVGKYEPNYVEEMSEIASNSIIFSV